MPHADKVAIIGLDGAEPSLVFERWASELPNLGRLRDAGLAGTLQSTQPPLGAGAWSCMATGKDPGTLGVYGARERRDWSYEDPGLVTNLEIRQPRLWDHVARAGLSSVIVGVPQTFPLVRRPRGCLVTCQLTPGMDSPCTHPPELAGELAELVGDYLFDVRGHRTNDKAWLREQAHELARQRFTVARHLLTTRPWDLFWMVELGLSRIQHGFWRFMDANHAHYQAGNPYEDVIHDYYVSLDRWIGELLDVLDLDRTAVWVLSAGGTKRLDGAFCINDWLIREGLLVMKTPVTAARPFELGDVDWSRTKVWAAGGSYGRLYLNKTGREPRGLVSDSEYDRLRDELIARLEALADHDGRLPGNHAYKPERMYETVNGTPPDVIVVVADMQRRCTSALGQSAILTEECEGGPDDANHAAEGLYVLAHPGLEPGWREATLYDVVPTTLELLGVPSPRGLRGASLLS